MKFHLFENFNICDLKETGYTKLPNGLIIQWGRDIRDTGNRNITFPIPFKQCFSFIYTPCRADTFDKGGLIRASGQIQDHNFKPMITNTGASIFNEHNTGTLWLAIGI